MCWCFTNKEKGRNFQISKKIEYDNIADEDGRI